MDEFLDASYCLLFHGEMINYMETSLWVSNLRMEVIVDKDVGWLYVTMDISGLGVLMNVF